MIRRSVFLPICFALGFFRALPVLLISGLLWTSSLSWATESPEVAPSLQHGLALHGEPELPADFTNFSYANPAAPQGGTLRQGVVGSFDSLNPFIVRGQAPSMLRSHYFASLMWRNWDEPFTLYPYVARAVHLSPDNRTIQFYLDADAQFHDGSPITAVDIRATIEALREHGKPGFRSSYALIENIISNDPSHVALELSAEAGREMPLVLGMMPILKAEELEQIDFSAPSLTPLIGSGPYQLAEINAGTKLVLERVEQWWGNDVPALAGHFHLQNLEYEYFRDADIARQAFLAGEFDLIREFDAVSWVNFYDFPAVEQGAVTKLALPHRRPDGMNAFVFNTRRFPLDDIGVRQALAGLFDFAWVNRNLLHDQYQQTTSFFANSNLAGDAVPGAETQEILTPFADMLPPDILSTAYQAPQSDGSGRMREEFRHAQNLLQEAGWEILDGKLYHPEQETYLELTFLLGPQDDERVITAWAENLRRLGVEISLRRLDATGYQQSLSDFDFDLIRYHWRVTLSPGTEQLLYWSSEAAQTPGSRNYAGVSDPVVDALISQLIEAQSREELVATARALDRVLLAGHYVVPLYHLDRDYIAYWGELERVTTIDPLYGTVLESWWRGTAP